VKLSPPAPSWRPTGAVSSTFPPCSHSPAPEHSSPGFCAFALQTQCLHCFGSKVVTHHDQINMTNSHYGIESPIAIQTTSATKKQKKKPNEGQNSTQNT